MGPSDESLALADALIAQFGLMADRIQLAYAIMRHVEVEFADAQPSPAGQGESVQGCDELRARTEGERSAYLEGLEEGKLIAARQPVGQEPVMYQVLPRRFDDGEGWRQVTKRQFDDRGEFPGYAESDWERRTLYDAPPAQAVDLRPLTDLVAEWSHLADQMQGVLPQGSQTLRGYADQLKGRIALIDKAVGK